MDINVTINVETGEEPKVEVKKPVKKPVVKKKPVGSVGGVIEFPAPRQPSSVLDILGIKET